MTLVIKTGGIAKNPIGYLPGTLAEILAEYSREGEPGFAFDFTRFDGMFQDRAGTTPVTGIGQPVGLVRDLSGKGLDAIAEDDETRPLTVADSNGVLALDFGNQDYRLKVEMPGSTTFETRVILAACKFAADNNSFPIRSYSRGATNNFASMGLSAASSGKGIQLGNGPVPPLGDPITDVTVPYLLSGLTTVGDPDGRMTLRVNGVPEYDETLPVTADSDTAILIGGRPSSAMKGIVYGVAWRAGYADLEACERYFARRVGIELAA